MYLHKSILLVLMIRHIQDVCTLDVPHDHQIVRILQHLSSKNSIWVQPCLRIRASVHYLVKCHHEDDINSLLVVLQQVSLCLLACQEWFSDIQQISG